MRESSDKLLLCIVRGFKTIRIIENPAISEFSSDQNLKVGEINEATCMVMKGTDLRKWCDTLYNGQKCPRQGLPGTPNTHHR
jgi:hypothetical protein